jgi:hypothetical protein
MDFWIADDVKPIAEKLITDHRPELEGVNIVYMFKEKAGKKGDKLVIATAKKVSPKDNVAHSFKGKPNIDFIIEIGNDAWKELDSKQKEAVVFHELCHCAMQSKNEGDPEPTILQHEVEEFSSVIELFGCYTHDIQKFVDKALEAKAAQ